MAKLCNVADIRFYLYVSTSKLNMLYEQIYKSSKRTRRTSISAVTPIGSASLESASEENVGRDEKLRAVEEELDERRLMGALDEPKDYFRGTMRMRWGLFDDCGSRPEDEPALVFFGGFDKTDSLIVGLGGSSKHVAGHEGNQYPVALSYTSPRDVAHRGTAAG